MKIFDKRVHGTPMVKLNEKTQIKALHKNTNPFQRPMEEAKNVHHALLEARFPSHTFEQNNREISSSKVDPIIGRFLLQR